MCATRSASVALAVLLAAAAAPALAENLPGAAAPGNAPERAAALAQTASRAAGAADPASAPNDHSIAAELLAINQRIALLSARLKELELQARLAAKRRELASEAAGAEGGGASGLPALRAIDGVGKHLKATLAWASGIVQTAGEGEPVAGGWRVAHVELDAVELARGSERVRLGFGSAPASSGMPHDAPPAAAPASMRGRRAWADTAP